MDHEKRNIVPIGLLADLAQRAVREVRALVVLQDSLKEMAGSLDAMTEAQRADVVKRVGEVSEALTAQMEVLAGFKKMLDEARRGSRPRLTDG